MPEILARARAASGTDLFAVTTVRKKRRVLLADDSITTRSLEKSILEGAGYHVTVAVDGADAWRLLQELGGSVDLVVSDVEMPNMADRPSPGKNTAVETIRASPRFQHLPVILVTGLARDEHRARGLAAGASAYLVKSAFDQQQLLDTIEQVA